MSTRSKQLESAVIRPLALRRRADLIVVRQSHQRRACWAIKDPLALRYYRLTDEEFAVLEMLDGQTSYELLKQAFDERFAPLQIEYRDLTSLVTSFHDNRLVTSDASGQGAQLSDRRRKQQWREWLEQLSSPLTIRFRGISPRELFEVLYPLLRWMFSPVWLTLSLVAILAALLLVASHFDEVYAKLPSFHDFFTLETNLWLLATLGVTKVLHEFGHGLTCKHFGGEVPEIGFMLLCFSPCLYCNVSDSTMLRSKWRRAAVAAAGIYVELLLAGAATFLWWWTAPGMLNQLALRVMFVCSVSTLLFNANPLMRYDAYYILSDLVEIPNLHQKSNSLLKRGATDLLLGITSPVDPTLPEHGRGWWIAYAIACVVYRWGVTCSVLWFFREFFRPYDLMVVADLLAMLSLYGLLIRPAYRGIEYLRAPGTREQLDPNRARLSGCGLAALLLCCLFVPLPHRVFGALELAPYQPQNLYIKTPGRLTEVYVEPGQWVASGALIARLDSVDLDLEIAELTGKRDRCRAQANVLHHRRFDDIVAAQQLPEVLETLAAYDEELSERLDEHACLTLIARRAGMLLPAPEQAPKPPAAGHLKQWSGSPFDELNRGCHLETSTLLGQIGDPTEFEASLVIDQADLPFVRVGQAVDVKLDQLSGHIFRGVVEEIAADQLDVTPRHLSNKSGGELPSEVDDSGVERPTAVSYPVRARVTASDGILRTGFRGRGKVFTPWQSLAQRVWYWFASTFHFAW
jgi:putative peptide zinc metalloprotease protein